MGCLDGNHLALAIADDGSLAATYDRGRSLTLRDGATLEPIRALAPPSGGTVALLRWGLGLSFSSDGRRLAACMAATWASVCDTEEGETLLRLPDRLSPRLSSDGALVVSKGKDGFFVTDVATGRDLAARAAPKYPHGMASNPYLARLLMGVAGRRHGSPAILENRGLAVDHHVCNRLETSPRGPLAVREVAASPVDAGVLPA